MRPSDRNVYFAGALFGVAAGIFFRGAFDPGESRTAANFALSGVNGAVIALAMIAAHRQVTRHAADWLRRRSLAVELLVDGGAMVAAAVAAQFVAQFALFGRPPPEIVARMPFAMAFSLAMATIFLSVAHVVRLIGARQFMNVLSGRYRRPVEQPRIFLFVDLKGATRLAETLGPVRVADLIARFFHDIDDAILDHGGEVHAYIGDEVIVTWPVEAGAADAACVRCVFAMRDRIAGLADSYAREFGVAPAFRAALHCGPVVISEVGRSKEQIGYFGDTMNVTARLEEHAKRIDRDVVVSGALIDRLAPAPDIAADDLGPVALRGRAAPVRVFALAPATGARE